MKKQKLKPSDKRRAAKKGQKKVERKKIAKKHLEQRRELKAALKRKEEKIWQEYYDNLMGG
jgi:hypothetical protein